MNSVSRDIRFYGLCYNLYGLGDPSPEQSYGTLQTEQIFLDVKSAAVASQ